MGPAVAGSDGVVNTVGHYVEQKGATFEAIHGQGAMHVARASATTGVRRLVHISGIGADLGSESPYVRARAIGEPKIKPFRSAGTWARVAAPRRRAGSAMAACV